MKQLNLLDDIKTKKCSRCEEVKSVSEFSKNEKAKDKLQIQCKRCEEKWRSL